jgi:hypothetical protein
MGIDGLEVEVFGLDGLPGYGSTAFAVSPGRQEPEEVVEFVQGEGGPYGLGHFGFFGFRSSRMRRNIIQVISGTYCLAPAQLERRMMSQMDQTRELTDCWVVRKRWLEFFFRRAMMLLTPRPARERRTG